MKVLLKQQNNRKKSTSKLTLIALLLSGLSFSASALASVDSTLINHYSHEPTRSELEEVFKNAGAYGFEMSSNYNSRFE